MKTIDMLSIQPTFLCNYNCEYCYLGNLRKDKTILDLDILKQRLEEITKEYIIKNITLYGGEISLLPKNYIIQLISLCENINIKPTIVSNLSNDWLITFCDNNNYTLSISLNEERSFYQETLNKLKQITRKDNKNLSIVVLPSLLNKSYTEIMDFYENLGFDIFFIQYHPSILSQKTYNIDINDFSNFLKNVIEIKHSNIYNINILNEIILKNNDYNPMMDGCLFINPNGKYSTIIYDNHIEHYEEFDSLIEWNNRCQEDYKYYFKNCCLCDLFGKCKAEHLDVIETKECSGLYNLLKWYKGKKWN